MGESRLADILLVYAFLTDQNESAMETLGKQAFLSRSETVVLALVAEPRLIESFDSKVMRESTSGHANLQWLPGYLPAVTPGHDRPVGARDQLNQPS